MSFLRNCAISQWETAASIRRFPTEPWLDIFFIFILDFRTTQPLDLHTQLGQSNVVVIDLLLFCFFCLHCDGMQFLLFHLVVIGPFPVAPRPQRRKAKTTGSNELASSKLAFPLQFCNVQPAFCVQLSDVQVKICCRALACQLFLGLTQ